MIFRMYTYCDFYYLSMYLSICMGEVLGDLVEISIRTWLCLEIFFALVYAVSYLPLYAIVLVYFIFGWFLFGWMLLISNTMNRIKLQLIPRINIHATVNESSNLLSQDLFSPPKYLNKKLERRTAIGRYLKGEPANKHQLLFTLADRKGPEFAIFLIRLIMLLSAIYISGLLFICYTAPEWWYGLIYVPLAIIPVAMGGFIYAPRVLRL